MVKNDSTVDRSTMRKYTKLENEKDYLSVCEYKLFSGSVVNILSYRFLPEKTEDASRPFK